MSRASKKIRATAARRADGVCEACGEWIGPACELGHLDHFFGRAHVPESVSNCWLLCPICDAAKTLNAPTASWWLRRFVNHCVRYDYSVEVARAETRLAVLSQKFPSHT